MIKSPEDIEAFPWGRLTADEISLSDGIQFIFREIFVLVLCGCPTSTEYEIVASTRRRSF